MRGAHAVVGFLSLAVAAAFSRATAEPSRCSLSLYASLPLSVDAGGGFTVPVKIAGEQFNLLIDTGGVFSMLTERAVAKLAFPKQRLFLAQLGMIGGRRLDHFVEARDLELSTLKAQKFNMMVMPDDVVSEGVDGIVGPDLLGKFDVDFDFAAGKVNLFSPDHCPGKVVYWTQSGYAAIPFVLDQAQHIKLGVTLDGMQMHAILDTGASRSFMSLETAERLFKLDDAELRQNRPHHAFKALTLGAVSVANPEIILLPDSVSQIMGRYGEPNLILGMGIIRQLHLYLAYGERKLYITAAGAH